MHTSKNTLKVFAAIVWIGGSVILILKGSSLIFQAEDLLPGTYWIWGAAIAGIIIGFIKARFLFNRFCRKNIERIEALTQPKFWQFYRTHFFVFLFLMVLLSATLSRLAEGNFVFLLLLAVLDLTIGVALLGSFPGFFSSRVKNGMIR